MSWAVAILAGGEGARFKPYTDMIPKPMIPVGRRERPILEYIVGWLKRFGLRRFVFLVGYRWRQIENYFRDGSWMGVEIKYSLDDDEYRGTGGALLKAVRDGLLGGGVLVWYGDILAPLDVSGLLEHHESRGLDVTIVVTNRYQVPVGVAEVGEDGVVTGFVEKPWLDIKAAIGVLVVDSRVLESEGGRLGRSFDLMAHLVPSAIKNGFRVGAYVHEGPWFDVGSLERYAKIDHDSLDEMLGVG